MSRIGERKDPISHEDQRGRISSYANSRGLPVEFLPEESDVSGGRVVRPILEQALTGIEDGRYAGVIVAQLDRLSRMELVDALAVIRRVEQAGGQVLAVAENFDVATPEGRVARNMFLSVAEMQLERYRSGFSRSKEQAVAKGIWPCPVVPTGYRCVRRKDGGDGRLYPETRAAKRVVRGFEARAAGASWREVAQAIGVGPNAAAKIIRKPVYLGRIEYTGFVNAQAHEPLVSRELWEAAQLHQPRPARAEDARPALLRGLVYCAGCGHAMTPDSYLRRGEGRAVYRCRRDKAAGRCEAPASIAQAKLDTYVERLALEAIDGLAVSAQERSLALERAMADLDAAEAERDAYQAVTRVTDIGAEQFTAGMRSRVEAVEAARAHVAAARAALGPVPAPSTLRELWPELDVGERGHVLRGALGAVWVRRGHGLASERARIVAAGYGPARNGRQRLELRTLDWTADLPGEIRPTSAQNIE